MKVRKEYAGKSVMIKAVGLVEVTDENLHIFEAFGLTHLYYVKDNKGATKRTRRNIKRVDHDKQPDVAVDVRASSKKDGDSGNTGGCSDCG